MGKTKSVEGDDLEGVAAGRVCGSIGDSGGGASHGAGEHGFTCLSIGTRAYCSNERACASGLVRCPDLEFMC